MREHTQSIYSCWLYSLTSFYEQCLQTITSICSSWVVPWLFSFKQAHENHTLELLTLPLHSIARSWKQTLGNCSRENLRQQKGGISERNMNHSKGYLPSPYTTSLKQCSWKFNYRDSFPYFILFAWPTASSLPANIYLKKKSSNFSPSFCTSFQPFTKTSSSFHFLEIKHQEVKATVLKLLVILKAKRLFFSSSRQNSWGLQSEANLLRSWGTFNP